MNEFEKEQGRTSSEIEGIKEREKRMKERVAEWSGEMKKMWEMIGAGAGTAKVVEDPRPNISTPKDVKTETGARPKERKPLIKSEKEISNVEEKKSDNEGTESEEKVVEKNSKRQRRRRSKKGKIENPSRRVDSLYSSEEEKGYENEEER